MNTATLPSSLAPDLQALDRWLVAYTKPRQESVALQQLEQQGYEAYLPLYKKFKKTENGPAAFFEPMFPRYILLRPGKPGQSIFSTRVAVLLAMLGRPVVLDLQHHQVNPAD